MKIVDSYERYDSLSPELECSVDVDERSLSFSSSLLRRAFDDGDAPALYAVAVALISAGVANLKNDFCSVPACIYVDYYTCSPVYNSPEYSFSAFNWVAPDGSRGVGIHYGGAVQWFVITE